MPMSYIFIYWKWTCTCIFILIYHHYLVVNMFSFHTYMHQNYHSHENGMLSQDKAYLYAQDINVSDKVPSWFAVLVITIEAKAWGITDRITWNSSQRVKPTWQKWVVYCKNCRVNWWFDHQNIQILCWSNPG